MMKNMLEAAEADFRRKLSADLEVIEVPEWLDKEDKPMKIYYKPVINFRSQEKIHQKEREGKLAEQICMTLIVRALDENGKEIFKDTDLEKLMRFTDPDVISRLVLQMIGTKENLDDLKKS